MLLLLVVFWCWDFFGFVGGELFEVEGVGELVGLVFCFEFGDVLVVFVLWYDFYLE